MDKVAQTWDSGESVSVHCQLALMTWIVLMLFCNKEGLSSWLMMMMIIIAEWR